MVVAHVKSQEVITLLTKRGDEEWKVFGVGLLGVGSQVGWQWIRNDTQAFMEKDTNARQYDRQLGLKIALDFNRHLF